MLILGLDPGTARLGFGLVEVKKSKEKTTANGKGSDLTFVRAGCLETKMDTQMGERLLYLQEEIGKILREHRPDVVAVEQLFFGINARTAIAVGQARGIILSEVARHKIPLFEYQGLSVKFALTGFGRSDKKQMQASVMSHLKMKQIVKPDDAADGLAIAIAHYLKTIAPTAVISKTAAKKKKQ